MEITEKTRDNYIDVIKGIGIISIVIGHASWIIDVAGHSIQVGPFVYLYHLAVFFFCSGYLYRDNITDFWQFVGKKLKSLMTPFIGYTVLYMIFRSLFVSMGILAGEKYNLGNWFIGLTNMVTFNGVGEFLGAFWFLPVLFFSLSFYAAVNCMTRHIKKDILRRALRILLFILFGLAGIYTTEHGYGLLYNMQISYLMVPVVAAGHYFAVYKELFYKTVHVLGGAISFVLLIILLRADVGIIELSQFMIINRYLFYPVTFCGIYFCFCLAKIICKSKIMERIFALAGTMSFDIMALHFLSLKLVDYVVCTLRGRQDVMNAFPHSFDDIWPVYYLAGVILPIVMKKGYMKCKLYLTGIWRQRDILPKNRVN